jgi:hypothetical protein
VLVCPSVGLVDDPLLLLVRVPFCGAGIRTCGPMRISNQQLDSQQHTAAHTHTAVRQFRPTHRLTRAEARPVCRSLCPAPLFLSVRLSAHFARLLLCRSVWSVSLCLSACLLSRVRVLACASSLPSSPSLLPSPLSALLLVDSPARLLSHPSSAARALVADATTCAAASHNDSAGPDPPPVRAVVYPGPAACVDVGQQPARDGASKR